VETYLLFRKRTQLITSIGVSFIVVSGHFTPG